MVDLETNGGAGVVTKRSHRGDIISRILRDAESLQTELEKHESCGFSDISVNSCVEAVGLSEGDILRQIGRVSPFLAKITHILL